MAGFRPGVPHVLTRFGPGRGGVVDELEQLNQQKKMLSEQLSTLERRLFDLEVERGVLLVALGEVEARLRAYQLETTKQQYGITAGSVVTHEGQRYKVVTVFPSPTGKPWVRGLPLLECGTVLEGFPLYLFDAWKLDT
jgi:hypothetical protein